MKIICWLNMAALILFAACNSGNSSGEKQKTQVRVNYNRMGQLESEISHIDGLKHGPAKYYYDNGKLQYLIPYDQGKKHGESVWYYENGNIYQVTPFNQGKEDGIKKKYYESGNLMAEVPYKNGIQQPGLKEYKENGKLVTDYPDIVFREPEKTGPGRYFLRFRMSNNTRKVLFSQIVITSAGDTIRAPVHAPDGIGEIPFFVAKGGTTNARVIIHAEVQTPYNNRYITENEYFVKISNP